MTFSIAAGDREGGGKKEKVKYPEVEGSPYIQSAYHVHHLLSIMTFRIAAVSKGERQ